MTKYVMIAWLLTVLSVSLQPCAVQGGPGMSVTEPKLGAETDEFEDDFSPGLGIFAFFAVIVMLMIVGAGLALTGLVVAIVGGLCLAGIVTTSALVGVMTKRPREGFRAFFLMAGSGLGALGGAGVAVLVRWVMEMDVTLSMAVLNGAAAGLIGGVALAWGFNLLWGWGLTWLQEKTALPDLGPDL